MADSLYLEVTTPLARTVRVTRSYWEWEVMVTIKHPIMRGKETPVQRACQAPMESRRSKTNPDIYLHYGIESPDLICVVAHT